MRNKKAGAVKKSKPPKSKELPADKKEEWSGLTPGEIIRLDPDGLPALKERVAEIEGDLVRIVELIIHGDIDSAKFREILTRRQGKAKGGLDAKQEIR